MVLFEEALRIDPSFREARENLAGLLASQGKLEEGVAHFLIALEQAPDDSGTRLLLARALEGLGRWDEAAAQYREVIRRERDHEAARLLLREIEERRRSEPG